MIDALKRRGHVIGPSAVSPSGSMLLNVDWKLMTYDEARELLRKEAEKRDAVSENADDH